MTIKKLSQVATFLRENHAKTKFSKPYYSSEGELIKSCSFYNANGDYIGRMTRIAGNVSKKPVSSHLKSYVEIVDADKKKIYQQLKENIISFAKVFDSNKNKTYYLPEKMTKTHVFVDNNGVKTTDMFERTIDSKLKLLSETKDSSIKHFGQNSYEALEPISYKEVLTKHTVEHSNKI